MASPLTIEQIEELTSSIAWALESDTADTITLFDKIEDWNLAQDNQ